MIVPGRVAGFIGERTRVCPIVTTGVLNSCWLWQQKYPSAKEDYRSRIHKKVSRRRFGARREQHGARRELIIDDLVAAAATIARHGTDWRISSSLIPGQT